MFDQERYRFWDDCFQNLIDAVEVSSDARSLRNAVRNFTSISGFDRYAFLEMRGAEITALTDYPIEWQRLYLDRQYMIVDPVVTTAKRKMDMFAWSGEDVISSRSSRELKRFFGEASEFGIRSGVSIPIGTSYSRTAILTLSSHLPRVEVPNLRHPLRAALAVAFIHVHLQHVGHSERLKNDVLLSTQEATCLSWSSYGMSMKEIADLIGIKPRTVQFYLNNARDKLGAKTLQHAVRIAMENQLI